MNEAERIHQHPLTRWWTAFAYASGRHDQHIAAQGAGPHVHSDLFADRAVEFGLDLAKFPALYELMASATPEPERKPT